MTPPVVTITAPSDGVGVARGAPFDLQWSVVGDDLAPTSLVFIGPPEDPYVAASPSDWEYVADLSNVPDGPVLITVTVFGGDFGLESGTDTITVTVTETGMVLSLAAQRLYEQFEHLEPDDGTYPWATVCAALAAPIDPIYDLVAGGERPWSPAVDLDEAAAVLPPDFALGVVRWLGQFAGLTLAESLNLLQQRVTLQESTAAKRMTPSAIKGAVRAVLIGPDGTPATATVYLTERIGDDPYVFAVATLNAETPDPSAVERVLLDRVGEPNGARQWTVTVIAGGTYAVLKAVHATYSEVKTDFATYADVRADPSVT